MTLDWMVYALWLSLLVSAAAWVIERAAVARGIATRWIWTAALVMSALLPLALPFATRAASAPQSSVSLPAYDASAPGDIDLEAWSGLINVAGTPLESPNGSVYPVTELHTSPAPPLGVAGLVSAFGWRPRMPEVPRMADLGVVALWIAISLTVFAFLARASLRLQRMRSTWPTTEVEGHSVLVSNDVGPAVVGVLRSAIVLPSWSLGLPSGERRLILRHEDEHLRAHDLALLSGAALLLALFPWNAAIWWQTARLRFAVEVDCDRRVLSDPRDLRRYAMLLIEIGRRGVPARVPALAIAQSPSLLERRIQTMTRRSKPRLITTAALVLAGALIGTTAVTVERPEVMRDVNSPSESSRLASGVGGTSETGTPPDAALASTNGSQTTAASLIGSPIRAGEIRGTVKDPNSGLPVSEVHVYLVGGALSSISSESGGYVIANVPAGTYELRAERIGYVQVTKQLSVVDGTVVTADLEMITGGLGVTADENRGTVRGLVTDLTGAPMADVQIVARRTDATTRGGLSRNTGTYMLLNLEPGEYEIRAERQGMVSAAREIKMVGGAAVELNFQLAAIGSSGSVAQVGGVGSEVDAIRRALANRTPTEAPAVFIDGVLLEGAATMSPGGTPRLGDIDPSSIQRVEIIQGPAASALYGPGGASGLIKVYLKKPTPPPASPSALDRAQELQRAAESLAQRMADAPVASSRLSGKVTTTDGSPLSDVQVYVSGPNLANGSIGGLSRLTGTYVVLRLPAGTYELHAEKVGYKSLSQQVNIIANSEAELNITLAGQSEAGRGSLELISMREIPPSSATAKPAVAGADQRPTDPSALGRIVGLIHNQATDEPVRSAQIALRAKDGSGLTLGALSRANGVFVIVNVPPGVYDVEIIRAGFKPVVVPVTINTLSPFELNALLTPLPPEIAANATASSARHAR